MSTIQEEVVREISPTVAMLHASEIDQQIATAHRFPRSLKKFRDESLQMVTLTESIATECIYALPRDGKVIEGPSARFAEIVASAWGNCRAGARVVNEQGDFVVAQGVFHDLERNVAITYEVQRRIVNKSGKRFSSDMIGVTANAACSIALRNAILKGVPKAFWADQYAAARQTAAGDFKTLANRRADAIKAFVIYGIKPEQIFGLLGVKGEEDITIENLVTLRGMLTALQEGDTTPEQMFQASEKSESLKPRAKSEATPTTHEMPPHSPAPTIANGAEAPIKVESKPLGESIVKALTAKLEAGAISESDLFKHFNVSKWSDFTTNDLDKIKTWIANPG